MDLDKALGFASSITTMRGQISDLGEGDIGILLIAKKKPSETSIVCVTTGDPGSWEILGLLEYATIQEKRFISENTCNGGPECTHGDS